MAAADALEVVAVVEGETLKDTLPHPPGAARGTIEIQFPRGYPMGREIVVRVTALAGGRALAAAEARLTLTATCAAVPLDVGALDAGVD